MKKALKFIFNIFLIYIDLLLFLFVPFIDALQEGVCTILNYKSRYFSKSNSDDNIKPCSCGNKAELRYYEKSDGIVSYKVAYIECDHCGNSTRYFVIDDYYGIEHYEDEIIKAWNKEWR